MEVDFPPLNGLADSIGSNGRPTDQKVVQFSEVDDIQIFQQEIDMRPKQKVARRMRIPAALPPLTSSTGGADSSPASPRKPQSPAKLKKLAEKDRHSRTGRRGMPKKGGYRLVRGDWRACVSVGREPVLLSVGRESVLLCECAFYVCKVYVIACTTGARCM